MIDWTEYERDIRYALLKVGVNTDQDLEDLTQATYVRVLERPFDGGHPRAYINEVARGVGIDFKRQETRRARIDTTMHSGIEYGNGELNEDSQSPTVVVSQGVSPETQSIQMDLLIQALSSLTLKQRNAFILVDILGFTFQEGADESGVTKASFHRMYQRAKGGLKRWGALNG